MVWGHISANGMGSLLIWKSTITNGRYDNHINQHQIYTPRSLLQVRPCIFQLDNVEHYFLAAGWLCIEQIRLWTNSTAAHIRPERDKKSLPKLQQLASSVPRWLQTFVKRGKDAAQCKHGTVLQLLRHVTALNLKHILVSKKNVFNVLLQS